MRANQGMYAELTYVKKYRLRVQMKPFSMLWVHTTPSFGYLSLPVILLDNAVKWQRIAPLFGCLKSMPFKVYSKDT